MCTHVPYCHVKNIEPLQTHTVILSPVLSFLRTFPFHSRPEVSHYEYRGFHAVGGDNTDSCDVLSNLFSFVTCSVCDRLHNFNFQTGFNEIKNDYYVISGFARRMFFNRRENGRNRDFCYI